MRRYHYTEQDFATKKAAQKTLLASNDAVAPAKFYMVSALAHCSYETRLIKISDAAQRPLGSAETSNKRVIYQFIHPFCMWTEEFWDISGNNRKSTYWY